MPNPCWLTWMSIGVHGTTRSSVQSKDSLSGNTEQEAGKLGRNCIINDFAGNVRVLISSGSGND